MKQITDKQADHRNKGSKQDRGARGSSPCCRKPERPKENNRNKQLATVWRETWGLDSGTL